MIVAVVTGLTASSLGNTVSVSFSELSRATEYRVTPNLIGPTVTLQPSDAVNGVLTVDLNLQFSTFYNIYVQATVTNTAGISSNSETASVTLTTGGNYFFCV